MKIWRSVRKPLAAAIIVLVLVTCIGAMAVMLFAAAGMATQMIGVNRA